MPPNSGRVHAGAEVAAARKPVEIRPLAQQDLEDHIACYLAEAGADVAGRFLDEVEHAFDLLSRNPSLGSLRYGVMLNLPGVRCWPLRPWPQLIFYVDRGPALDVFRILHGARDIPSTLVEGEG